MFSDFPIDHSVVLDSVTAGNCAKNKIKELGSAFSLSPTLRPQFESGGAALVGT